MNGEPSAFQAFFRMSCAFCSNLRESEGERGGEREGGERVGEMERGKERGREREGKERERERERGKREGGERKGGEREGGRERRGNMVYTAYQSGEVLCEEAHLFTAGGFPLHLHVVIKGDPLDGRLRLSIKLTDVTCVVHLAKARDN